MEDERTTRHLEQILHPATDEMDLFADDHFTPTRDFQQLPPRIG